MFTKQSIAEISQSLENPSTDPKYYHRKKKLRLTETVPPCLVKIDPPGKYDVQRLVIAAEDMFKNTQKRWLPRSSRYGKRS